ncbi:MAG: LysR family transcriptional regulator [Dorea sp.]|nr:LysR family transcriptional regulator [Dorea sp.]
MSDKDFCEKTAIHSGVKVWLEGSYNFFGPGTIKLLKMVDEVGSVREACARLEMSYSKGWKLIHKTEEQLGYQVVERSAGGKKGGKAEITDKGKALIQLFEEYENRVAEAATKIYKEMFEDCSLF